MIAPDQLFSPDLSFVTDFGSVSSGEIFNRGILENYGDILSEGDEMREQELKQNLAEDFYRESEDNDFLAQLPSRNLGITQDESVDYSAPPQQRETVVNTPQKMQQKTGPMSLKLSNYGYDSDSSPDHNSNVLRIGHANNRLEDGVSAALTKSLASRLGLKTGDMFEAVTADGQVLRRRYDDTVPTTYKGRKLPETVDLYELKGSNSFGGKVIDIRPIK